MKMLINQYMKNLSFTHKYLNPIQFAGGEGLNSTKTQKKEFEELPIEIQNKIYELENWAKSNLRQSKMNLIWFWILKIPAILFSASTGVFAMLNFNVLTAIFGSISSLCILIDGIFPRGTMRNLQIKAVYEIRLLQNEMVDKWRIGEGERKNVIKEIITFAKDESRRINTYLINSEMINSDKNIK